VNRDLAASRIIDVLRTTVPFDQVRIAGALQADTAKPLFAAAVQDAELGMV
jgi:hypothetical protein